MKRWEDCLDFPWRQAGWFWCKVLDHWNFVAITTPWAIYVVPEYFEDQRIVRHEYQHVAQMRNDGRAWWWVKAGYYLWRYGYKNSPYEIEARTVQHGGRS